MLQLHQQSKLNELPLLEAEVLQVHAPPFVSKETNSSQSIGPAFSRVQRRRSFIKKVNKTIIWNYEYKFIKSCSVLDSFTFFCLCDTFHVYLWCLSLCLQKRRDRAAEVPNGDNTSRTEVSSATEDISVPKDLDLIALPQLCFPGIGPLLCVEHVMFRIY